MSDVVSRMKLVAMKLLKNCLPYCKVIETRYILRSFNQFPPLQPAFSIELVRSSTGEQF